MRDLKHLIYLAYVSAGAPTLDEMADVVAASDLDACPSRDTIGRLIGDSTSAGKQADVIALVRVLTRMAAGDVATAAKDTARLWTQAQLAEPLGQPIASIDPYALEVHHAIAVGGATGLPKYVEREHDVRLRSIVTEAASGATRLVMLVGTSSTGKTRACWEAIQQLPPTWRLWHPIAPERPQAMLADLARVGPQTVIWLNEAQHYLLHQQHGEAIAAGLRSILRDTSCSPVLILGTIWPGADYFDKLTTQPPVGEPDPFNQARVLLSGREIRLPNAFTPSVIDELKNSEDPRLAEAAALAKDGMLTQYLAGAPELMKIYSSATEAARSLLEAAMDARRLGHPLDLPRSFLQAAAEGYLSDTEWELLPDNWLGSSLKLLTNPVKGACGPLHPQKRARGATHPSASASEQTYRLADFLDQHGRTTRHITRIPALFWQAAIQHSSGEGARSLAEAAVRRGLTQIACALWAKSGDFAAIGWALAEAGRPQEAHSAFEQAAATGDAEGLTGTAQLLWSADRREEALAYFERAAAAGDREAFPKAAHLLACDDQLDEAMQWFERAAAAGDLDALSLAAFYLANADQTDRALAWYKRAAAAGDHHALRSAADLLAGTDQLDEALEWYERAVTAGDPEAMRSAADHLAEAGRWDRVLAWYERTAQVGDHEVIRLAAEHLAQVDRWDEALAWYERAVAAGDPEAMRSAAEHLAQVDRWDEALAWYERAVAAGDPEAMRSAAEHLAQVDRWDEALAWYERAAAAGDPAAIRSAASDLAEADRWGEALAWYERAVAAGDREAIRWKAHDLGRADRWDEALAWYERAVAAGDHEAIRWAAYQLGKADRWDEALAWYERATAEAGMPSTRRAVDALRKVHRFEDAQALRRYGWDPSGGIAAPWRLSALKVADQ
ncbi:MULTISPECIES: lipopolysaccharide assembly protein LapB [Streptomyces]|nr:MULTISPECIES: tetratricopeptide repeat protein [Streptomyces]QNQ32667.1 tetratricopeptide repeat protein [Streptomyces sp. CB00271]